jgi:hypothetical protein
MAKAKKKISGDAAGTPPTQAAQAPQRDGSRQARRDLDDALRAAQAREAADALRRATAWLAAIATLEELLGNSAFVDGRETLQEAIESTSRRISLRCTLDDAANQTARKHPFAPEQIVATRLCICGGRPHYVGRFDIAFMLGETIKALRELLEADLAIVRRSQVFRRPAASVESSVLRVLLRASSALSAEEIAKRLRDGKHGEKLAIDAKGVADAILRLREDCGFKIDNNGKGYRLDNLDRENARAIGFVETPDGTDGT